MSPKCSNYFIEKKSIIYKMFCVIADAIYVVLTSVFLFYIDLPLF